MTVLPLDDDVGEHVVLELGLEDEAVIVEETLAKLTFAAVTVTVAEVPAFKPETITGVELDDELRFPTATVPAEVVAEYVVVALELVIENVNPFVREVAAEKVGAVGAFIAIALLVPNDPAEPGAGSVSTAAFPPVPAASLIDPEFNTSALVPL